MLSQGTGGVKAAGQKHSALRLWPYVISSVLVDLLALEPLLSNCLCPIRHGLSDNSCLCSEKCCPMIWKRNTFDSLVDVEMLLLPIKSEAVATTNWFSSYLYLSEEKAHQMFQMCNKLLLILNSTPLSGN